MAHYPIIPGLGGGESGAGFLRPLKGISPPRWISLYWVLGEERLLVDPAELLGVCEPVDREKGLSVDTNVSTDSCPGTLADLKHHTHIVVIYRIVWYIVACYNRPLRSYYNNIAVSWCIAQANSCRIIFK